MTRIICFNRKYFEKCFGYGLWGLATIAVIIVIIASSVEIESIVQTSFDYSSCSYNLTTFFTKETYCVSYWEYEGSSSFSHKTNLLGYTALIVDTVIIGLWIYYKQNKVKFGWCNKE